MDEETGVESSPENDGDVRSPDDATTNGPAAEMMRRARPMRSLVGRRRAPPVDGEGELYERPAAVTAALCVLLALVVIEGIDEVFALGDPSSLFESWIHDAVIVGAGGLVLVRAWYEPIGRAAWLLFGVATLVWGIGDIAWSLAYEGHTVVPYPTFADVLWLLWYPLTAVGIALLISVHVDRFELHRWMDGIAVMLLVLAGGVAVIIEPAAEHATLGPLATGTDLSYPVLDVLIIGAILGVYGLLGWRPDRMWVLLGLGVLATSAADSTFAVQALHGVALAQRYEFVWAAGAVLVAGAAWSTTSNDVTPAEVTGLRAIALLLVAQAVAAGIQIYALVGTVGKGERIVTLVVLLVTSVQIVLSRPRSGATEPPRA